MTGAKMAIKIVIATITKPVRPIGLLKMPRFHQTRFIRVRGSATFARDAVGAVTPVLICSSLFDPRIEIGVKNVDREIDKHKNDRQIEHGCLHKRIVAVENGLQERIADAIEPED